jgi:hypothetical protein
MILTVQTRSDKLRISHEYVTQDTCTHKKGKKTLHFFNFFSYNNINYTT